MGPQRAGVIDADASSITKGNLNCMPATQTAPQALSAEQVKAILKEARQHSTRDWCLLLLTFRHALRSSEARTLKLADIDLKNSTITIARVKGSRSGVQSLDRHRGEPILDEVLALRSWPDNFPDRDGTQGARRDKSGTSID